MEWVQVKRENNQLDRSPRLPTDNAIPYGRTVRLLAQLPFRRHPEPPHLNRQLSFNLPNFPGLHPRCIYRNETYTVPICS